MIINTNCWLLFQTFSIPHPPLPESALRPAPWRLHLSSGRHKTEKEGISCILLIELYASHAAYLLSFDLQIKLTRHSGLPGQVWFHTNLQTEKYLQNNMNGTQHLSSKCPSIDSSWFVMMTCYSMIFSVVKDMSPCTPLFILAEFLEIIVFRLQISK